MEDVSRIVAADQKQRYALLEDHDGALWIRANQGHSLKVRHVCFVKT